MSATVVRETRDYDQFNGLFGNRQINKPHLMRIKKSIEENGQLFSVIIVNEKKEIVDGQHRFRAFKEMSLPVWYVVKKGYGLKHVQVYNQNTKNWTLDQFAESYAELGSKDYELYIFFKRKYGFGHSESMAMLNGSASNACGPTMQRFKNGKFKVKDFAQATKSAENIIRLAPYYDGFKRRSFVLAMLKIMATPGYDHEQMVNKISYQSGKIKDQTRASDYIAVLERIYNYKTRSEHIRFDLAA